MNKFRDGMNGAWSVLNRQDATGVKRMCMESEENDVAEWLWRGWLVKGDTHLLAGAPGTGKSTLAMAIAATLSCGGRWPDGTRAEESSVLIWSGEDDLLRTLRPRLSACGAKMKNIHAITGMVDEEGSRPFDPAIDGPALMDMVAVMEPSPSLLILDPIVSAVTGDSHKNAEVRRSLQPFVDLARTRQCAVLGITHFSKGTSGRDPVERITGSLAFGALSRVVLVAAKIPDEEGGGRIFARAKNNLGLDHSGFHYDLQPCEVSARGGRKAETVRVLWGEAIDGSARGILAEAESAPDLEERTALDEAVDFLLDSLKDGPVKAEVLYKDSRRNGIAERTLRRAKSKLGITSKRLDFSSSRVWSLPEKNIDNAENNQNNGSGQSSSPSLGQLASSGQFSNGAGSGLLANWPTQGDESGAGVGQYDKTAENGRLSKNIGDSEKLSKDNASQEKHKKPAGKNSSGPLVQFKWRRKGTHLPGWNILDTTETDVETVRRMLATRETCEIEVQKLGA